MKRPLILLAVLALGVAAAQEKSPTGRYSDHPPPKEPPKVTLEPFFPPEQECWNPDEKFTHPPEFVAPQFVYPFEFHGRDVGEATILVQIDEFGFPRRLAVVTATGEIPARLGVEALKKARWWVEPNAHGRTGVWFFYRADYHRSEPDDQATQTKPNQTPQRNAGSRPSSVHSSSYAGPTDDRPASETPSSLGPRG